MMVLVFRQKVKLCLEEARDEELDPIAALGSKANPLKAPRFCIAFLLEVVGFI